MGIQGLLPMLKEVSSSTNIKDWSGKRLAVDAYVWLHRGAYGCATDLALGKPTVSYVSYAMHRVRLLLYHKITPIIVFDGGLLPSKMGTEDEREKRREENLKRGMGFYQEGKLGLARECFVKAVDVTPEMAFQLIKALRREGVQYIVAPYEADPQLAYLESHSLVDGIITEDSDLLIFGCRNVLFKLDSEGNCVHVSKANLTRCREFNFSGWGEREFRWMAIFSGCDYLNRIAGVGLKKAYALVRKWGSVEKVIQIIRLSGSHKIPTNYLESFQKAELTFNHQRVFDPIAKKLVFLNPLPPGMKEEDLPFIGGPMSDEFAQGVANGDINPITKKPMIDINPQVFSPTSNYKPSRFDPSQKKSSSSSKSSKSKSQEPLKGKGSIFNYFSKQQSTSSGSSSKVIEVIVSKKRDSDGKEVGKGKGVESKFFSTSSVAEDNVEVEDEFLEEDDEGIDYEALEAQERGEEGEEEDEDLDFDAEEALREVSNPQPTKQLEDKMEEEEEEVRDFTREPSLLAISSPPDSLHTIKPEPFSSKRRRLDSVPEFDLNVDMDMEGISSPPESILARSSSPVCFVSPTRGRNYVKKEVEEGGTPKPKSIKGGFRGKIESSSSSNKGTGSDPIELFSDGIEEVDVKPKVKKVKKEVSSKKKRKEEVEEGEEEEEDGNFSKIAQGWRAQFMNPSLKSKTPPIKPPKSSSSSRLIKPLPTSSRTKSVLPSLPTKSTLPPLPTKSNLPSLPTKSSLPSLPAKSILPPLPPTTRAPLSPKKMNTLSCPTLPLVQKSPEKEGRSTTIVTNKRLLQFRFNGAG